MNELAPWGLGILVVIAILTGLFFTWRRNRQVVSEDSYTQGLELWLAGDLPGATRAMRRAIEENPDGIDSYQQLGNLLRQSGEAGRAAALHRGLTVRPDIPHSRRLSIALSLADDLLDLGQWDEAGQVIDSIGNQGRDSIHFCRCRFRQALGKGQEKAAALALKDGIRHCRGNDSLQLQHELAILQLDRALDYARQEEFALCRKLLKDVPDKIGQRTDYAARRVYTQAFAAAGSGNADEAVTIATQGLLDYPQEMELFLPLLQDALLASGRFERSIPILERACQTESSPPALWIALVLLYEKTGNRTGALEFLCSKSESSGLTPDVAAPFLKALAAEDRDSDFGRAWGCLTMPLQNSTQACNICGNHPDEVHWFCRSCGSFDSFSDRRGA